MAKKHEKHDKSGDHGEGNHNGHNHAAANGHMDEIEYAPLAQDTRAWGQTLAITGVRLIDGTGDDPIERATVMR